MDCSDTPQGSGLIPISMGSTAHHGEESKLISSEGDAHFISGPGRKKSESLDCDIWKVAPPPTLLYSDVNKLLRIIKNTVIQTVIRVPSS